MNKALLTSGGCDYLENLRTLGSLLSRLDI